MEYGPVVAKQFLYGDRNTSGVLERIKAELKKQIEENIPERKRRPVRQIVGLMTEAETKENRIVERRFSQSAGIGDCG